MSADPDAARGELDAERGPFIVAGDGRVWHKPSALGRPTCWPQADPDNISTHATKAAAERAIEANDDAPSSAEGYPRACRECFPAEGAR